MRCTHDALPPSRPLADRLAAFGNDPWWLVVIKAVLALRAPDGLTLFNIWCERRVVARMQHRIGPNVHGPLGLLQSLADGVKLVLKEDIIPKAADKVVFILAPIIAAIPAFMAFAVIPFGPEVTSFTDIETPLQLTDMPVAVLFMLAVASVGIYGIVLAGWSAARRTRCSAALRSSAQMISYEVAMGLVPRRGVPVRRLDVDLGDRRSAGALWFGRHPAAVVRHLH